MRKDIKTIFTMQEFVMKKNLTETFRRMEVGSKMRIKTSDFKIGTARSAASRLKQKGILVKVSEKDLIDEYEVERL